MKALVCILLLLETFVFVVQQQVDGGLHENEISSEDGRPNPPQTDTLRDEASTDSQRNSDVHFSNIYAALRELTATVTEQKGNIRELREEMKKKDDEISNLTLSQVEELRKDNRDREIAFSASLLESGSGFIGPFKFETILTYKNVFTNIGNAYNPITGIFTAPLKGAYMFRFSIYGGSTAAITATIVKNEEHMVVAHHQDNDPNNQGTLNSSNGVVLILEVGDAVFVKLWPYKKLYDNSEHINTFSGYLLFPLREDER